MSLFSTSIHFRAKRGLLALALAALVAFAFIGLVYNAAGILRLPQSGLKTFEIVWVSLTACLLVIMLAMAMATALEHLGEWLAPKPRSEEWLREEVRHHRVAGMEVAAAGGEATLARRSVRAGKPSVG
jgi:hypothetical protein